MKVRDSGMPDEKKWNEFFDTNLILNELQISSKVNNLVEVGSGYGTFTLPMARRIRGKLYAFEIDKNMTAILLQKKKANGLRNIVAERRDVLSKGTGLPNKYSDYVALFNILHNENPKTFLDEAHRVLELKGKIGILHWRSDIRTPRGPDLSIRPKPMEIMELIDPKKFKIDKKPFYVGLYHYGLVISKK